MVCFVCLEVECTLACIGTASQELPPPLPSPPLFSVFVWIFWLPPLPEAFKSHAAPLPSTWPCGGGRLGSRAGHGASCSPCTRRLAACQHPAPSHRPSARPPARRSQRHNKGAGKRQHARRPRGVWLQPVFVTRTQGAAEGFTRKTRSFPTCNPRNACVGCCWQGKNTCECHE